MLYLYIMAGLALAVSVTASRDKTLIALEVALKRFLTIMPAFLAMLILVSIALFLVPDKFIADYLGKNSGFLGVLSASLLGSIILLPGFIAFPLCGILLGKGVTYMVLSAFTTTLMMVGVLTYPVESRYFGARVTVMRNTISFCIALVIAIVTGICYREIL